MQEKRWIDRKSRTALVFILCLFAVCFLWYTKEYPISILSVDDWTYISYKRLPVPLLNAWNPTRVFPEVYMPLMGYIGAFLIYPFTGDYLQAITLALGFGVSLVVVLYVECFRRLVIKKLAVSDMGSILPALLFWLLHFTIFLSDARLNKYLLGGDSQTNLYYYTLSSLLNFSTVFILESMDSISAFLKAENGSESSCF